MFHVKIHHCLNKKVRSSYRVRFIDKKNTSTITQKNEVIFCAMGHDIQIWRNLPCHSDLENRDSSIQRPWKSDFGGIQDSQPFRPSLSMDTPWKFNIAPEKLPSQEESSLPTIFFCSGAMLNFGGVSFEVFADRLKCILIVDFSFIAQAVCFAAEVLTVFF